MDNRKEIIENILNELNDRSGFDDWWHNIGEDIQEEITETLVNLLPINEKQVEFCPECSAEITYCDVLGLWKCNECEWTGQISS